VREEHSSQHIQHHIPPQTVQRHPDHTSDVIEQSEKRSSRTDQKWRRLQLRIQWNKLFIDRAGVEGEEEAIFIPNHGGRFQFRQRIVTKHDKQKKKK
jgi:hypothetical protein